MLMTMIMSVFPIETVNQIFATANAESGTLKISAAMSASVRYRFHSEGIFAHAAVL